MREVRVYTRDVRKRSLIYNMGYVKRISLHKVVEIAEWDRYIIDIFSKSVGVVNIFTQAGEFEEIDVFSVHKKYDDPFLSELYIHMYMPNVMVKDSETEVDKDDRVASIPKYCSITSSEFLLLR